MEVLNWVVGALVVAVILLGISCFANWDRLNGVSEGGRSNHGLLSAIQGQIGSIEGRLTAHGDNLGALSERCDTNHSFTKDVFEAHRSLNARCEESRVKGEQARTKINENFRVTGQRLNDHKNRFWEMERRFSDIIRSLGNRVSNCEAEVKSLRDLFPTLNHRPYAVRRDLDKLTEKWDRTVDGFSSRIERLERERSSLEQRCTALEAVVTGLRETNANLDLTCRDQELRLEVMEKEFADGGYIRMADLGLIDVPPTPPQAVMMIGDEFRPMTGPFGRDGIGGPADPTPLPLPAQFPTAAQDREKRAKVARVLGEAVLSGFPNSASDLRQQVAMAGARQYGAERIGEAILGRLEGQTWAKGDALIRLAAEFLAERGGDLAEAYEKVFKETAAEGPNSVPLR